MDDKFIVPLDDVELLEIPQTPPPEAEEAKAMPSTTAKPSLPKSSPWLIALGVVVLVFIIWRWK